MNKETLGDCLNNNKDFFIHFTNDYFPVADFAFSQNGHTYHVQIKTGKTAITSETEPK